MIELKSEADLLKLIEDKVPESLHLDYKRSESLSKSSDKRRELAKDVAAFATAEGGVLIYAIAEDEESHVASTIDRGLDPNDISKEWIEQVIDSNVSPRIEGIRINSIELVTTSPGRFSYVINIPPSPRAPHMVFNRYYMRQNFQSVPMEDYQVRDVMSRQNSPKLEFITELHRYTEGTSIRFGVENIGLVAAENLYIEIDFHKASICPSGWAPTPILPVLSYFPANGEKKLDKLTFMQTDVPHQAYYGNPTRIPPLLYPGIKILIRELMVSVRDDVQPNQKIVARLYAKNMPVVEKHIALPV